MELDSPAKVGGAANFILMKDSESLDYLDLSTTSSSPSNLKQRHDPEKRKIEHAAFRRPAGKGKSTQSLSVSCCPSFFNISCLSVECFISIHYLRSKPLCAAHLPTLLLVPMRALLHAPSYSWKRCTGLQTMHTPLFPYVYTSGGICAKSTKRRTIKNQHASLLPLQGPCSIPAPK